MQLWIGGLTYNFSRSHLVKRGATPTRQARWHGRSLGLGLGLGLGLVRLRRVELIWAGLGWVGRLGWVAPDWVGLGGVESSRVGWGPLATRQHTTSEGLGWS